MRCMLRRTGRGRQTQQPSDRCTRITFEMGVGDLCRRFRQGRVIVIVTAGVTTITGRVTTSMDMVTSTNTDTNRTNCSPRRAGPARRRIAIGREQQKKASKNTETA